MEAIERLLAYEEIRQLASRYALAMDSRDLDALVALFVEDVRVGREASGREALKQSFEGQLAELGVSILFVGNHVIDLQDGEHATGSVYCRAAIEVGERWIEQAIVYGDDYARRDSQWLFVRRRHELFYGVEAPTSPLAQSPANWPENHAGRGTLPEAWKSWQAFHAE